MIDFLQSFDYSKPLSLYIHIPFCLSKCSYCAFYSIAKHDSDIRDKYVQRLLLEIETVNDLMKGQCFETAFIGGGNPGCLGSYNLEKIAKAVCKNGRPREFSVEMNPESLDYEYFPLFETYFTRLSMGIQSLNSDALAFLERNASLEDTIKGLNISQELKAKTGCNLSYDLITCLGPWHDEKADLEALLKGYPSDHISVYALTLEEGTELFNKGTIIPDSEKQYEILSNIWQILNKNGFEHYEVSNFAKEGKRCIHNCKYWSYKQYMGLGAGAASTAFDSLGKVRRFNYKASVCDYIAGNCFTGWDCEELSSKEAAEELIFMGLRHKEGLNLERFKMLTGKTFDMAFLNRVEGFVVKDGFLVPTEQGLMLSDAAAESIIDYI